MLGSTSLLFLGVLSEWLLGLPLSYFDIAILFKFSTRTTNLGQLERKKMVHTEKAGLTRECE